MRIFKYTEQELELIIYIKDNSPKRIWSEIFYTIFDYENFYICLECESFSAETSSDFDEVIIVKVTKEGTPFVNKYNATLIFENEPIDSIEITTRFLYFSNVGAKNKIELNKIISEVEHNEVLNELLSNSTFVGEEFICHPNSEEAKKASSGPCNLAEIGFVFKIKNHYLAAFSWNNCFGFPYNNKLLSFKEIEPFYKELQFIHLG